MRDQRELDGCWAHVDAGVPANRAETERSLGRNLWIGCARIQCTTENSVQFSIDINMVYKTAQTFTQKTILRILRSCTHTKLRISLWVLRRCTSRKQEDAPEDVEYVHGQEADDAPEDVE